MSLRAIMANVLKDLTLDELLSLAATGGPMVFDVIDAELDRRARAARDKQRLHRRLQERRAAA